MGVTIHYTIAYENKGALWKALDKAEKYAREVFKHEKLEEDSEDSGIYRESPFNLIINFPGCESVTLHFKYAKTWVRESRGWSLQKAYIDDYGIGKLLHDRDWEVYD